MHSIAPRLAQRRAPSCRRWVAVLHCQLPRRFQLFGEAVHGNGMALPVLGLQCLNAGLNVTICHQPGRVLPVGPIPRQPISFCPRVALNQGKGEPFMPSVL
jgi:hypothetical protein